MKLSDFPLQTYDKIRYADTDRQGHVNNAVFATLLETGRVELLYNAANPLHEVSASFVIASLKMDFLNELTWPGEVEIGTAILRVGNSSVTIKQGIFQDKVLAASAETIIVHVSTKDGKSIVLSEDAKMVLEDLKMRP